MKEVFLQEAEKYAKQNHRRRAWRKFVQVMACVVVFCTTYALILPAITMERNPCDLTEHTHSESCYEKVASGAVGSNTCTYESLGVHVHTQDCYNDESLPICGQADYLIHEHNDDCMDENGAIVCQLPEVSAHVHTDACYRIAETEPVETEPAETESVHTHSEDCYGTERGALICKVAETEGHSHGEKCYTRGELVCQLPEQEGHAHGEGCSETVLVCDLTVEPHLHGNGCYVQQTCDIPEGEEHTHTEECTGDILNCDLTEQPHVHTNGCWQTNSLCDLAEVEGHAHGTACYESLLTCELSEEPAHQHTDECYEMVSVLNCGLEEGAVIPAATETAEPELICTEPVAQVHIHSEECFTTENADEDTLTCTLAEDENHTHSIICYGTWKLICTQEEHTHDLMCQNDPEADVETRAIWEATFAHVVLTGDRNADVLAIAETQLGYVESSDNYVVWEDGTVHGYTRYGEWYGVPHGDWCGMFVSFCLRYAEVDNIPINYGVRPWIEDLRERKLYHTAEEYTPRPGDIVFYDWEGDGLSDHVGIVAEIIEATEEEPAKLKAIEGNSSNCVQYVTYDLDDEVILGYSELPEKETYCGLEAHIHGNACSDAEGNLICTLTEHTHTEKCEVAPVYYCGFDEHTHDEECSDAEGNLICTLTEHTHTEECMQNKALCICGLLLHSHSEACSDESGELICGLEEHTESVLCSVDLSSLVEEDREAVINVIMLIEQLPSAEEIDAKLMEYENAGDLEGQDVYFEEVWTQVCYVYSQYALLSEEQKACVTNADKLLELEYMWADMEEISTFAEYTIPENFTSPVSGVNTHKHHTDGTELLSFDEWRGFVYSKHFLETATNGTYLDAFEAPANAANYARPNYRCLVIKEKADGSLYVAEHIWASTLKSMTPKQLAAKLDDTTKGFFYLTNAKAEFTNNAANDDYYPATGKLVEVYFNWKYFTEVNYWVANPGFSTINLNVSSPANIGTKAADDVHATLNLYNYDETINDYDDTPLRAMSKAGYLFFHDNVVLDGKWGDPINPKEDSVDGIGGREASLPGADPSSTNSKQYGRDMYGLYNLPVMEDTLDPNGFPQSEKGTMQLYFDPNGSYHRATMENGGGLFRKDSEGYWWYDSVDTAAYYDQSTNRFKLYNCSLVPAYTIYYNTKGFNQWADGNYSPVRMGNFLPFNDVNADTTRWLKPLIDTAKKLDSTKTATDSNLTYSTQNYVALKAPVDNWFGMTMDIEFYMPEDGKMNDQDMIFDFHGDDDVFVYIGIWDEQLKDYDYRLVLDIGGTHGARSGNINFATGAVLDRPATDSGKRERTLKEIFNLSGDTFEDYTNLKLKFYYMERGGNISYCRLRFNLPTLPQRSLTVTKELTVEEEGLKDFLEDTYVYDFRVVKADSNGNPTTEPMIQEGEEFIILENGAAVGFGTVGADGWFQLKAGQSAEFDNMAALTNSFRTDYFVEERLPVNLVGQYEGVEYVVGSGTNTAIKPDGTATFTTFQTGKLAAEDTQHIIYRNKVDAAKLGTLKVTKTEAMGSDLDESDSYRIQVKLGGILLPVGTEYTVTDSQGNIMVSPNPTVQEAGILQLKVGQTATITKGILAGTVYEVTELDTGSGFHATYSGTVTAEGTMEVTESGVSGDFPVGGEVHITVTNSDYRYSADIPFSKEAVGNNTQETFRFNVEQVTQTSDGIWIMDSSLEEASITVTGDSVTTGSIFLTYTQPGIYNYRISEKQGDSGFLYDSTFYIVEVTVTEKDGAVATNILKNGTESVDGLRFVNYRAGSLTLGKQVEGSAPGTQRAFMFTLRMENTITSLKQEYTAVRVKADGTTSSETITFIDSEAVISLKSGESLSIDYVPYGTVWAITETDTDGYIVSYCVNGGSMVYGDQANGSHNGADTVVSFLNKCSYELPNTGGVGTTSYTMAGLVLMIFSMAYLLYRSKARRMEEF